MSTNGSGPGRGYVLVTGASSGIGQATVKYLAEQGFTVFAGVRGGSLDDHPVRAGRGSVIEVPLDVTDSGEIATAAAHIGAAVRDEGLMGVVNNAGRGFPGPLEALPVDDLRQQLEVNLVGQVAVTQVFLPLLRRRHQGRVIFVGSIGGKIAVEFAGAYHASKYAMEAIADAWRQELQPEGISVAIIEPGTTSTDIWDKAIDRVDALIEDPAATRYRARLVNFRQTLVQADRGGMSAQKVARTIEQALTETRPASRYPVGFAAQLAYRVRPLVPDRVFDRLARLTVGS